MRFLDKGQDGESYAMWAQRVDNHEVVFGGKADKWNAFADRGDDQRKCCLAADYTDEWFATQESSFRCYYVCGAMTGWGGTYCSHMILSDRWETLHEGGGPCTEAALVL